MQKVRTRTFWTVLLAIAMLFGLAATPVYAADDTTTSTQTVVDDATQDTWSDTLQNHSSVNMGRIWTDKSVWTTDKVSLTPPTDLDPNDDEWPTGIDIYKTAGADFMVGLSALSSTSSQTTTKQQPLDIVLILDESGSMVQNTFGYGPTYTVTTSGGWLAPTYYALVDGKYIELSHVNGDRWQYNYNGQNVTVSYKRNAEDTTSGRIQFYTDQYRLDALRTAVSNFINQTAAKNEGVDEAEQHRISIVTYSDANDTKIDIGLTPVSGNNQQTLLNIITNLDADGVTRADLGFSNAYNVISQDQRQEAKKVVIFFTDGQPCSTGSTFQENTANAAVRYAKQIKDTGATVYSVGIFDGADPDYTNTSAWNQSNTDNANLFMHAVSSNYPNAQSYDDLDQRADNSNYFKAASDPDALNGVFTDILDEIASAEPPTQVNGEPNASGEITFTDTLGDFMEVKAINALVYAGQLHTPEGDGFSFSGKVEGNDIYGEADLSDVKITVTKGTNGAGDTVEVKIPATMIPLRYYEVDTVNGQTTMNITEALPIRLFYSVGMTAEGKQLLSGDTTGISDTVKARWDAYVKANTDKDGNVHFYSNAWQNGVTAQASFTPNTTNSFYYFTEDTQLYIDQGLTTPATDDNSAGVDTLYYPQSYYVNTDTVTGAAELQTVGTAIDKSAYSTQIVKKGNNYYLPANTKKTDKLTKDPFTAQKSGNSTGTAATSVAPAWGNGDIVTVALGNNGRITAPAPKGNLAISKTVTKADTKLTPDADQTFSFQIQFTGVPAGDYTYTIGTDTTEYTLTVGADGTATLSGLKATQTATIQGLPAGAGYTVTEDSVDGYTQTTPANGASATGSILAGKTATAAFTNEYSADDVTLSGNTLIKVSKTFTGPAGVTKTGDFTFTISANDNAPLPNDHELTLTGVTMNGNAATVGTFGAITYSKPGTYTYTIAETKGTDPGVTYDADTQTVTVTVKDDGHGQLTIESVQYGNNATAAAFENSYEAKEATLSGATDLKVSKTIDGRGWLDSDAFTFTLTPDDASYPMPAGNGNVVTLDKDHHSGNFGDITYETADVYTYSITENNLTADSDLTKDESVYTVTVTVSDEGNGELKAVAAITKKDGTKVPEAAFTNVYTGDDKPTKEVATDGQDAENTLIGVGDVLTYTVNWTNTAVDDKGNAAAATVTVTDTIPAGTELVADSISGNGVESNGTITWNIQATAHESGRVSFQVRVTEDAATVDEISNQAQVTVGDDDPTYTNKVVNNFPKKEETTKPTEIQVGQTLHYTITFKADSANIAVIDTLSQGLEYNASSATLNGVANEPVADGQNLTWNLTGLTVGNQYIIGFDVTVTDAALTHVDNTATVGGHESNTVPTPVDTGDSAKHVADATGANIDGKLVEVGDELTYSIDWVNDIPDGNGTVTVTDKLPTGLENATAISDGGIYDEQTNTITWTIENQPAGQRGTVSFKATVSAEAPALLRNTASINNVDVSVDNYVNTKTVTEPEGGVQVGSVLTYTINYANHTGAEATVKVMDTLSDGLDYVANSAKVNGTAMEPQGAATGDLVWTLENVAAHETGTITFQAKVNENAVTAGADNKATIQVGDEPSVDTNTTETDLGTGSLTIHKDVVVDENQGVEVDAEKEFTFTVSLKNAQNEPLTGTYNYTGAATGTITNGGTVALHDGEEITIAGLPAGTQYEVTETKESGYTTTSTNEQGVIAENVTAKAVFTNTYKVTETVIGGEGDTSLTVTKNFIGRDWTDADSFSFTLTAVNDEAKAVLPEAKTITISNTSADHKAAFEALTFKKAAVYEFSVQEVLPDGVDENNTLNGITYDAKSRTLTIDVTDNGDGTLIAAVDVANSDALVFTNTYDANFPEDPGDPGSNSLIQIPVRKEISGDRNAMLEGESYDFTVTPDTDKTTANDELIPAADNSTLTLTADKPEDLFSIDFSELHDKAEALLDRAQSGDASTEDVEQPTEEEKDTETDTESVENDALSGASVAAAELSVSTAETAEPDVAEPESTPTESTEETVTVQAMPNIATMSLAEIETLDADQAGTLLEQICGDYYYTVSETTDQKDMRGGMTKDQSVYQVKITLSDKGDGTLELSEPEITKIVDKDGNAIAAENQAKAEKALFTNLYMLANNETTATISGTKVLNGRALKEGEFTFRLLDADGKVVQETTNLADGSFSFDLTYTKDLAGKYFGYTVKEVRGTDSTITYDGSVYAVQVQVVDDGNGTLSAEVTPLNGAIEFKNTYTAPAPQEETTTPAATPKPTPTPAPTSTPEPQAAASIVPQTGDSFPYMLLVVVACAAVVGLCVTFYAKKRKEH